MAYVFGAEDILAALGVTAADWEGQDAGNDDTQAYAVTTSKEGNFVAASEVAHSKIQEMTITLKAKNPAGSSVAFTLGGIGTAGVVITRFTATELWNDNATLSVTAHKHTDTEAGATHLATPVSAAVSLSLGFGVGTVRLGGTLKDCQRAELTGSVSHLDRYSNKGKFLVGASHGLRYEATEEYVDSGSDITTVAPWKQDSQNKQTRNTDFYTRVVRAHAFSLS